MLKMGETSVASTLDVPLAQLLAHGQEYAQAYAELYAQAHTALHSSTQQCAGIASGKLHKAREALSASQRHLRGADQNF